MCFSLLSTGTSPNPQGCWGGSTEHSDILNIHAYHCREGCWWPAVACQSSWNTCICKYPRPPQLSSYCFKNTIVITKQNHICINEVGSKDKYNLEFRELILSLIILQLWPSNSTIFFPGLFHFKGYLSLCDTNKARINIIGFIYRYMCVWLCV